MHVYLFSKSALTNDNNFAEFNIREHIYNLTTVAGSLL